MKQLLPKTKLVFKNLLPYIIFFDTFCSVERTTLQPIHKEIVHKKITELNVLYLKRHSTQGGFGRLWGTCYISTSECSALHQFTCRNIQH